MIFIAIPKSEIIWVTQITEDGGVHYITSSKISRDIYFLYESNGEVVTRVAKGKSPTQLEMQMKLNVAAKKI